MVLREVSRDEGTRYTDEQRDIAFKCWAFQANRNASATVRILAEAMAEDDGFEVSRQTIQNWAKAENWDDRANRDLFASAPALRFKTQTALILAAPKAAEFLSSSLDLKADSMSRDAITVFKIQSDNAQKILDRTGFSPVGTRDVGTVDAPPELAGEIRESLGPGSTTEQIKAVEDLIRKRSGIGQRMG